MKIIEWTEGSSIAKVELTSEEIITLIDDYEKLRVRDPRPEFILLRKEFLGCEDT